MRLYLIIHVKRCQDKNMTCHGNPSPTYKSWCKVKEQKFVQKFVHTLRNEQRDRLFKYEQ
jgi:hypothetical protein